MLSPSLRYNAFNGLEWSFQMKDLGFNEYGEVQGGDEESSRLTSKKGSGAANSSSVEMAKINKVADEDPEGDEEAEDTEIAI